MKKLILCISIIYLALFMMTGCSSSQEKMENFTDECYQENKALPMNQISILYEGYKKAGDLSAKGTLKENCPKTAKKYFK